MKRSGMGTASQGIALGALITICIVASPAYAQTAVCKDAFGTNVTVAGTVTKIFRNRDNSLSIQLKTNSLDCGVVDVNSAASGSCRVGKALTITGDLYENVQETPNDAPVYLMPTNGGGNNFTGADLNCQ
jgi:hypothetical protein